MWIIVGTKTATRPVPGGLSVTRPCATCRAMTTFHEHESQELLRLYFVSLASVGARRVLACGRCGSVVVTDEVGPARRSQEGTVVGAIGSALSRGKEAITSGEVGRVAADVGRHASEVAARTADHARNLVHDERIKQGKKALGRWIDSVRKK